MQSAIVDSTPVSAAAENAMQAQIATMRESLAKHRARARDLWNACAPDAGDDAEKNREALGRFTQKLLKGQMDEAYS